MKKRNLWKNTTALFLTAAMVLGQAPAGIAGAELFSDGIGTSELTEIPEKQTTSGESVEKNASAEDVFVDEESADAFMAESPGGGILFTDEAADAVTTLKIENGSIAIDAEGYTQDNGEKIPFIGEYVIEGNNQTVENNITINVPQNTVITVTIRNISICSSMPFAVDGPGTLNLILSNENTLNATDYSYFSALSLIDGANINISEDSTGGKLTAIADTYVNAAGIGSPSYGSAGNIHITSGIIHAVGGYNSPGIGSSKRPSSIGDITIDGGTITSIGSNSSAGIGSGSGDASGSSTTGNITINGGEITAYCTGNDGAGIGSGLAYQSGTSTTGDITILGGNITVTGGTWGAGIGSGKVGTNGGTSSVGNITIGSTNSSGPTIIANGGNSAAGIGSGYVQQNAVTNGKSQVGNITILSGSITATGGDSTGNADDSVGNGIGTGNRGTIGQIITANGNAFIYASSISRLQDPLSGVIFNGNDGQVYGTVTLKNNAEIPSEKTLTIPPNCSLNLADGIELINYGTINIETGGSLDIGSGFLKNHGQITGSVIGTIQDKLSETVITFYKNDAPISPGTDGIYEFTYGDSISITAKMNQQNTESSKKVRSRMAASNKVNFYQGSTDGTLLGTCEVTKSDTDDTISATLENYTFRNTENGISWKPGSYTITADFGGFDTLLESTQSVDIKINKAAQTEAPPSVTNTTAISDTAITLEAVTADSGTPLEYGYLTSESDAVANWQDTLSFTNLTPATAYTFYTRYTENDYYTAGPPSATGFTVYTAPTSGSGYTLDYSDETVSASEGFEISTEIDGTYTDSIAVAPGSTLYVRAASTDTSAAKGVAANQIPDRPVSPSGITATSVTAESIALTPLANAAYCIEAPSGPPSEWQDSNEFTDLSPATVYTFRIKYKATASAFASEPTTCSVYTCAAAPAENEGFVIDYEAETATAKDSFEISTDGNTWISSGSEPDFIKAAPESELFVRVKAAAYGAPASASTKNVLAPRPVIGEIKGEQITSSSITLTAATNAVYRLKSADGSEAPWQTSPQFTGLKSNTAYDFQVKLTATADSFASEIKELTVKTRPYIPPVQPTPTPSPAPTPEPIPENFPEGSERNPDGSITTPNGTNVKEDGTITLPNGTELKPDTEGNLPTIDKEGTVTATDGTIYKADGTIQKPDGTIIEPDGTIHNTDGSIQNSHGTYLRPATPILETAEIHAAGNQVKAELFRDCPGAIGYDYVISPNINCITDKDYLQISKNVLLTETDFRYLQKGTYYVYCHAWLRGENGKKVFSPWSNYKKVTVTATTPETPQITKVSVKGSTVSVTYTECNDAAGYDIILGAAYKKVYGEKRPVDYGTLVKKVKNSDTLTVTFRNVPKGRYFAGLHAWNRTSEDCKKVFSPWSPSQRIIVK